MAAVADLGACKQLQLSRLMVATIFVAGSRARKPRR